MDVAVYPYPTGDPVLIDKIVNEFLSQGKFDKLRKECMADADTKPAYQNLQQRVESTVSQFLKKQIWKPDLNKNQLRDSLRKHILESGFLDAGINRIVDQIVNPNVLATVFMPEVEEVVYSYLSIPRPGVKYQKQSDSSNKILGNTNSKYSFPEDLKETPVESEKDHRTQKAEEVCAASDKIRTEEAPDKSCSKTPDGLPPTETATEEQVENGSKELESELKHEEDDMVSYRDSSIGVKEECKTEAMMEEGSNSNNKLFTEKMELPSDESQESLSRMGVERLRISESDGVMVPDSDASLPLEINEKSMSDSRDSDDSIMNKMSPISQGRLTPEEIMSVVEEEKKPLTFIGRIPKLKRDDSESSKSSKKEEKGDRSYAKGTYSSDESDSSKQSFGKSDSDDKRSKERKLKSDGTRDRSDKRYKDSDDKKRKTDHHRSHSKDRKSRDEKSRSSRDEKDKSHSRPRDDRDDKNREKDRKSSSHSRSKSSSRHKGIHRQDKEHHRDDSKSRDKERSRHDRKEKDKRDVDRRKKEEEKRKKSKSVDDHGKERNKRDDRRSTDRDSNERDRSKDTGSNRMQSEGRRREKEQRGEDSRKEKNQEESDDKGGGANEATETVALECASEGVMSEAANERVVLKEPKASENIPLILEEAITENCLDAKTLSDEGALTIVQFPKVVDDFYVKFDSTGFRYFEDWETTKLDCEEEFKEFIDEAEKDLSLLSDDGSDYESLNDHMKSEARRQQIVMNSLRGLGNFANSLIFDPAGYDFYKWTNSQFFGKYSGKEGKIQPETKLEGNSNTTMMEEYETAEKNKENRGRDKKVRKSLKLLNRYQRKMGLKLKYGKEQHRFVRRRKKHFWTTDANGFKMREWNNGNPGGSETAMNNDSIYRESPRVLLLETAAEAEVLKEYRDLANHADTSDVLTVEEGSVDEIIYQVNVDGRQCEETSSGDCGNEEHVNNSTSSAPKMDVEAKIRLYQIQSLRRTKESLCPQKTCILARISSGSKGDLEDEEGNENVDNTEITLSHISKKDKKRGIRIGLSKPKLKREDVDVHKNFNLPLSPESDDSSLNNNGVITQKKNQRKRAGFEYSNPVSTEIPVKKLKEKRIVNQKYESQDLYKPRPFSIGSKTRGRALRAEENNFSKIEDRQK